MYNQKYALERTLLMYDHYIVMGPMKYNIKYRREFLVDFIMNQPDTLHIYVIKISAKHSSKEQFNDAVLHIKRVNPKLTELIVKPPHEIFLYNEFASSILHQQLHQQIMSNPNKKILWYTRPKASFLSRIRGWESIVYDCSDLWVKIAENTYRESKIKGLMKFLIARAERRIAQRSNLLFSTSSYLAEHLVKLTNRIPHVIENGVDLHIMSHTHTDTDPIPHIPKPRFGYVGTIKPMIDIDLLIYLAQTNPSMNIVLVGPLSLPKNQVKALRRQANVFFIDLVPLAEVPAYIQAFDVGLLPYHQNELTQACSPLKFFEYLACGIPVIGCGLPTTEKYREPGVYDTANDSYEQFAEKCRLALNYASDPSLQQRRKEVAQIHTWQHKFEDMLAILRKSL